MTAHEIHTLSGAYAVDALDEEERARFEEHLSACESCREEVASLQEAAALFGEVATAEPPAGLRERVLAGAETIRPLPPVPDLKAVRRRRRWAGFLAAAAAVGVITGGAIIVSDRDGGSPQTQISLADQVIAARDAEHVTVDLEGGASLTVYRSRAENRAAIVTRKMPAAPDGKVYQLWLQKKGQMVPAGLMSGGGDQALVLDGAVAGATAAGITVEPVGGSRQPTSDPIALFDFEQAT